uniref:Uncharacterized protein n=1 Tax=Romanomermis culicivorax TaxID=13658 RepID=A0A915L9U8_ROMCU
MGLIAIEASIQEKFSTGLWTVGALSSNGSINKVKPDNKETTRLEAKSLLFGIVHKYPNIRRDFSQRRGNWAAPLFSQFSAELYSVTTMLIFVLFRLESILYKIVYNEHYLNVFEKTSGRLNDNVMRPHSVFDIFEKSQQELYKMFG